MNTMLDQEIEEFMEVYFLYLTDFHVASRIPNLELQPLYLVA